MRSREIGERTKLKEQNQTLKDARPESSESVRKYGRSEIASAEVEKPNTEAELEGTSGIEREGINMGCCA